MAEYGSEHTQELLTGRLKAIAPVKANELLSRHTTFGIGGPADIFVTVRNARELAHAVLSAREFDTPFFVLGSGSNILVGDLGIRGVVIDNQAKATRVEPLVIGDNSDVQLPPRMAGVPPEEARVVWAESGASFAALARNLAREGYAGIEWACGIPGTMGGATVYNAGAYDGCLADVLLAATVLDADGETKHVPSAEFAFAYRTSALLAGRLRGAVVLSVELAVARGDAGALVATVAEFDRSRLAAQPRGRNSGSTFKNPAGHHAWELIDEVGLRGERVGGAQISEKHSNFIENRGDARAADVYALIREAQRRVKERFGIVLQTEVELVGEGF